MEVILLEKVSHLGNLGAKVKVRAGYGRNYLIPRGKAIPATKENMAVFEAKRAELEKKEQELIAQAQKRAQKLEGIKVTISAQVMEEGNLYGSVGLHEIAKAVTELGHELHKSEIDMPAGPIKQIGDYTINIHLHGDTRTTIKVKVIAA